MSEAYAKLRRYFFERRYGLLTSCNAFLCLCRSEILRKGRGRGGRGGGGNHGSGSRNNTKKRNKFGRIVRDDATGDW